MVIVNAEAVRETLLEARWLDPEKVRVVLNSVSLDPVPQADGRAALAELGLPRGVPVVCGAGRLTRQKGLDVLIRAFAIVRGEFPDARLLILGEGGQRGALEETARDARVEDAVTFAGHVPDVRAALSSVDVYALSSRNEGMANTLLEAMSVGAPIVATDVSGTGEAVEDCRDALVVPPEDPAALADGIARLLRDPELAGRLGSAALETSSERFGRGRMLDELLAVFEEGLERIGRSRRE
ncbi:MAG: glycosyltransferase [Candidatus Eisenbacteria bacterium]|nr:glycosyltransferase [Candidatus Eisenbacteria bacterium]